MESGEQAKENTLEYPENLRMLTKQLGTKQVTCNAYVVLMCEVHPQSYLSYHFSFQNKL